jgi:hypothetical protein
VKSAAEIVAALAALEPCEGAEDLDFADGCRDGWFCHVCRSGWFDYTTTPSDGHPQNDCPWLAARAMTQKGAR